MKVKKLINATALTSFGLSVLIHLGTLVVFGFWSYSSEKEFHLIKIPNSISVNLGGVVSRPIQTISSNQKISTTAKSSATMQVDESISKTANAPETTGSGSAEAISDQSGTSMGNGSGSSLEATTLSAKQKYFLDFRNLVEVKKEYPTMARMRGLEGVVVIAVTIKKTGEVFNHRIIKESGHSLLDQSALNLAKRIQKFKPFPSDIGSDDIDLKFPISYQLND